MWVVLKPTSNATERYYTRLKIMKLKVKGMICPQCGDNAWVYPGRRRLYSGWQGHFYFCACYRCHEAYLILFDQDCKFVAVVPNDGISERSGTLTQAGQLEAGEIPF